MKERKRGRRKTGIRRGNDEEITQSHQKAVTSPEAMDDVCGKLHVAS